MDAVMFSVGLGNKYVCVNIELKANLWQRVAFAERGSRHFT